MHKYINVFLVICFLIIAFVFSLGKGVTLAIDSYNYLDLGSFIFPNLKYDSALPYSDKPFTLHGPIYPLVIHLIVYLSKDNAISVIAFFQFFCLLLCTFFIYKITSSYVSKRLATFACLLFMFLPYNFIYATILLSETFTTLLFSIWLYVLFNIFSKSKNRGFNIIKTGALLYLASILTLTRFGFIPVLVFSFVLFSKDLVDSLKDKYIFPRKSTLSFRNILGFIFFIASIFNVYLWLSFNHLHYDRYTLSVATGRHLFNAAVVRANILPPANHPSFINFLNASTTHQLRIDQWGSHILNAPDELAVDKLYLDVAVAAIQDSPGKFIASSLISPFLLPLEGPAYYKRTIDFLSSCSPDCRSTLNHLCKPTYPVCSVNHFIVNLVQINNKYYPWITITLFALFLLGSFYALFRSHDQFLRFCVLIFFLLLYFQLTLEVIDGRYILPLYPIYTIIIVCSTKLFKIRI